VVGFGPAQIMDLAGPLEVFATANTLARLAGRSEPYALTLAAPQAGLLATNAGVPLYAAQALADPALAADTLLVAGGRGARAAAADPALMAALAALCARVPRVASICTGAFPLAATGLLDGRTATTHWSHFDEFAQRFPRVTLERDALYVGDARVSCSAGISAGIDFCLSLVEHDLGRAAALEVAQGLVVYLKRQGGQSQFSPRLAGQARAGDGDRFAALLEWMAQNLGRALPVELLAERAAMSVRNFTRRFAAAFDMPPAKYVLLLRIDAARALLSGSTLAVEQVAARCGFPSAEAMRVAFQRQLGLAPSEFRARFQRTGAESGSDARQEKPGSDP